MGMFHHGVTTGERTPTRGGIWENWLQPWYCTGYNEKNPEMIDDDQNLYEQKNGEHQTPTNKKQFHDRKNPKNKMQRFARLKKLRVWDCSPKSVKRFPCFIVWPCRSWSKTKMFLRLPPNLASWEKDIVNLGWRSLMSSWNGALLSMCDLSRRRSYPDNYATCSNWKESDIFHV